jgi:hypothetical protein
MRRDQRRRARQPLRRQHGGRVRSGLRNWASDHHPARRSRLAASVEASPTHRGVPRAGEPRYRFQPGTRVLLEGSRSSAGIRARADVRDCCH